MVYAMFGELSPDESSNKERSLSDLWALNLKAPAQSRDWIQVSGISPTELKSSFWFDTDSVGGGNTYGREGAYFVGGTPTNMQNDEETYLTTPDVNVSGLLRFDFASKQFSSVEVDGAGGLVGPLFEVPFGPNGTLISLGGSRSRNAMNDEHGATWNDTWIFNIATNTSYRQSTTGDVPNESSSAFRDHAVFSAIDKKHHTFEM
jgi:hypothetical protein